MSDEKVKCAPPDPDAAFLYDEALGCEVVLASGNSITYPVHCHMASFVIGLIRSGRIRLSRGGRSDCLGAGELFVIPPHQAHSLSAIAPYAILNLCLDATKLKAGIIRSIGNALRRLVLVGTISGEEYATLNSALQRIAASGRQTEMQKADDPLDTLRTGIVADPGRYSDLAGMADAVHLCPRHFIRTFRSRYGLPPRCYQRQSRLRRARRELATGTQSLAQTALRFGFFDQSHFIREFKKLYRMTPRQYQRVYRELPVSRARA